MTSIYNTRTLTYTHITTNSIQEKTTSVQICRYLPNIQTHTSYGLIFGWFVCMLSIRTRFICLLFSLSVFVRLHLFLSISLSLSLPLSLYANTTCERSAISFVEISSFSLLLDPQDMRREEKKESHAEFDIKHRAYNIRTFDGEPHQLRPEKIIMLCNGLVFSYSLSREILTLSHLVPSPSFLVNIASSR